MSPAPTNWWGQAAYLGPERLDGLPATSISDLYAFGVVFYEALAGVQAFRGSSPLSAGYAVQHAALMPLSQLRPDLPALRVAVVERAMDRDPERCFRTATEMAAALAADEDSTTVSAAHRVVSHRHDARRGRRRHRVDRSAVRATLAQGSSSWGTPGRTGSATNRNARPAHRHPGRDRGGGPRRRGRRCRQSPSKRPNAYDNPLLRWRRRRRSTRTPRFLRRPSAIGPALGGKGQRQGTGLMVGSARLAAGVLR